MTDSEISKLGGESEPLIVIADEYNAEAHLAQESPLARLARRGRAVRLSPGLSSPAEVRADLLEAIGRRGADDRDEAERQGTDEWRESVNSMSDEQLWTEYTHQWGDPPRFH
ncbi:hypothetical protein [Mycobacteroides abscessus]|uniref:hypothetical protein n=1 Tax=Mycobacteroides abscessus TaxID=36809 RepID=UPI0009A7F6AC|nr:hypothetical protein [Mycobacteroides abscessus]SLC72520.1 Uncharacterised protein [Mycobacteroides abscessus subsp. massiliense]SLJ50325.1 Uncharacterised protein [Mycobacteroides abscessus subsp. abscessus]